MSELKQCKQCGKETPLNDYYRHKSNVNGKYYYSSQCKICHKQSSVLNNEILINKRQGVYGIFSGQTCLYGESKQILHRIAMHKVRMKNLSLKHDQHELYIRIAKHSNVEVRILEETDNHKEQELVWIEYLNPLYNLA